MLRVGLTGGLGSGKSTVAAMFAAHGAQVLSADAVGRELMRPGQAVFARIVDRFGESVLAEDGTLDRRRLAEIAFGDGRVEELNAIVHPAVLARQAEWMEATRRSDPAAVAIVESALIFETRYGGDAEGQPGDDRAGTPRRFDTLILVAAARERKIERFIARASGAGTSAEELPAARLAELRTQAERRLAFQMPDEAKASRCDYILTNDGSRAALQAQVDALWPMLVQAARV